MLRIGFRRLLPLVFTAVHVVLIGVGAAQQLTQAGVLDNVELQAVAYQEDGGTLTVPFPEPSPLKPVLRIAILLDLPAFLLAAPLAVSFFPRSEMFPFYVSIPLGPLLWYGVGRWLDGILGYIQRLHLHRMLRGLIGVPATGLLCVSTVILTPLYHHRTADSYWVGTGMMLWSGLSLTIALSTKKAD